MIHMKNLLFYGYQCQSGVEFTLGCVDNQPEDPVFAVFEHLCVAFFARCATSRLKKRLDLLKINQKHNSSC